MQTETLLRRAQTGDADALDALVREYYPQILNYCRWHVPDAQQAQDAPRWKACPRSRVIRKRALTRPKTR